MTKLYLSGPMSGIKDNNFPVFHAEAARLRALGYTVVSPAEITIALTGPPLLAGPVQRAVRALVPKRDHVCVLQNSC